MTQNESETMTIPQKQPVRAGKVTIRMTYQEAPVDIELEGASTTDIERIIGGMLRREGWKPAKPPAGMGGFPPRKPQVPPWYDDEGNVCCPYHHAPLKKLEFGSVCSKKLQPGDEHAKENGWCKYVFRDGK